MSESKEHAPPWGAYRPSGTVRAVLWLSRHSIVGRGRARKTIARTVEALHPGPIDTELWGARSRLHPWNNVVECKALLRPDVMDAPERALLRDTMARPHAVFVDVGGNAGLYSLDAALHAGERGKIVMIEPDRSLISRFAFNLSEARASGRVEPTVDIRTLAVAISDRDGRGVLSAAGDEGSRNLVGSESGGLDVPLATMTSVVAREGLQKIDIMKIDVEGHEDKVLPPFLAAAARALWPRLILIEHIQRRAWQPDCIADALQRGYVITRTTRNNTFLSLTG